MRLNIAFAGLVSTLALTGCAHKGTNPVDPYEPINRKIYSFNMAVDAVLIKPPAKLYVAIIPGPVRKSINNAYNNLDLIPTVANDLLQAEGKWAIKDSWRFFINTTLGVGGLFDVANTFGLPPHSNDLGLTLAKWGDKNSPYIVIPLLGPSTIRDGSGWLFQFALYSPYVYLRNDALIYSLLGVRLIDLRSQVFDAERLMDEALDKYSFMRDAYLQHRNYLIAGTEQDNGSLFVDDSKAMTQGVGAVKAAPNQGGIDYVDE